MTPDFVRIAGQILDGTLTEGAAFMAASLLEEEIARRGKRDEYVYALARIALDPWQEGGEWPFELFPQDVWLLIRATPEQRARAFLQTEEL